MVLWGDSYAPCGLTFDFTGLCSQRSAGRDCSPFGEIDHTLEYIKPAALRNMELGSNKPKPQQLFPEEHHYARVADNQCVLLCLGKNFVHQVSHPGHEIVFGGTLRRVRNHPCQAE